MLDAFPRLLFFQKKNTFSGDHMGMRMRITMIKPEEGDSFLRAWAWDEPLCFDASDPDIIAKVAAYVQNAAEYNPCTGSFWCFLPHAGRRRPPHM